MEKMFKSNLRIKLVIGIWLCLVILLCGLLAYHYSFDPYTWLDPNREDNFSQALWAHRRNAYLYAIAVSSLGLGSFLIVLLVKRFYKMRLK